MKNPITILSLLVTLAAGCRADSTEVAYLTLDTTGLFSALTPELVPFYSTGTTRDDCVLWTDGVVDSARVLAWYRYIPSQFTRWSRDTPDVALVWLSFTGTVAAQYFDRFERYWAEARRGPRQPWDWEKTPDTSTHYIGRHYALTLVRRPKGGWWRMEDNRGLAFPRRPTITDAYRFASQWPWMDVYLPEERRHHRDLIVQPAPGDTIVYPVDLTIPGFVSIVLDGGVVEQSWVYAFGSAPVVARPR